MHRLQYLAFVNAVDKLCRLSIISGIFADSSSKKLLEGPPDADEFCCCEICGKYGLRSEFGASGRFCGLTCVGVYTGRRNKGREAARTVKALDGKVIKRKKRKSRKLTIVKQSSMNGVGLWCLLRVITQFNGYYDNAHLIDVFATRWVQSCLGITKQKMCPFTVFKLRY